MGGIHRGYSYHCGRSDLRGDHYARSYKTIVRVVFFDIGFERPVLIGSQTGRRRGFTKRNDVIIDQVLIVAGRVVIEFAFRHLLPVAAWHRDSIPMGAKIYYIKKSGTDWKVLPSCFIVFGLENDQKRTIFVQDAALFSSGRSTHVGM